MSSLEEKIENLVEPKIVNLGYELYDVQYVKEGKDYFLRIFIDKEPFINIDDCVNVTNLINPILDKYDFIDEPYMLDISSVSKGGNYE